jgi:hypothetical protein
MTELAGLEMLYEQVPEPSDNKEVLEVVPVSKIVCKASSAHAVASTLA